MLDRGSAVSYQPRCRLTTKNSNNTKVLMDGTWLGISFGGLGIVLIRQGAQTEGISSWLLVWVGLSFAVVSVGYVGLGARVFGKSNEGRLAWWSLLLLGPYLLFSLTVWEILTRVSREDCCHEIVPGLWVGRRPRIGEIPADVGLLVDMTCEFPRPHQDCNNVEYVCVPTLDGMVPGDEPFRRALSKVVNCKAPAYLFCAQGHGRSATLAAAVLIERGTVADVESAEVLLGQARPGIRLSRRQRDFARRMARRE
jgi:protein-tyrosine phosphatase